MPRAKNQKIYKMQKIKFTDFIYLSPKEKIMEKEKNIKKEKEKIKEDLIEKISNTLPRTTIEMLEQTLQIA